MASNSIIQYCSSSSDDKKKYHVFVSMCGDTRNNFTDFLCHTLRRNGIHFFDDRKFERGKSILPELLQAIKESQILIVVFSKGYASSTWCLRELEEIANSNGERVLPIFYDVTPSEVRKQEGPYEKAFEEYEEKFKEDTEMMREVRRWREALEQVSKISGWDIGDKPQSEVVNNVVQNVRERLQKINRSSPYNNLVGVESRVQELRELLLLGLDDFKSIGVCGLPGVGKTVLVHALCDIIYEYFDFHYVVDVKNHLKESNISGIRHRMHCQAQEENYPENYKFFPRTSFAGHGKRLIVLDNVDDVDKVEELDLNQNSLGAGSRVIIIARDRCILEGCGVNDIYEVKSLNEDNAIRLFQRYAFKGELVSSEFENMKYDVLTYLDGHPLLIKVVGRHLADLDVSQWRNAIVKFRKNPKKDILEKFRIIFDDLDQNEKEIFLDITCFYYWYFFEDVMEVLQFRGFDPESGLKILLEKLLIQHYEDGLLQIQNMLIDFGKYIASEESDKNPGKRTRLWDSKEFIKVMSHCEAVENLEVIIVSCDRDCSKSINVDAFSKMRQLKILKLDFEQYSGSLNDLSNELGYLAWDCCPLKCLPSNFQPDKLVSLKLHRSKIKRLWKGKKALSNLKRLDLSQSKNLVEMPSFEEALKLELLNFKGCVKLTKVHPSIKVLKKLTTLNLKDCQRLDKLPDFGEGSNLEYLNLEGCIQLKEIHESIGLQKGLTDLHLKDCKNLVVLPQSLLLLNSLEYLTLSGCSNLYNNQLLKQINVPRVLKLLRMGCIKPDKPSHSRPISSMEIKSFLGSGNCLSFSWPGYPCVSHLDLSFCNLHQIPDAIGSLCCLVWLNLSGNKFEKIPSLKNLSKLVYLNLEHCKQLKYLFELPSQTSSGWAYMDRAAYLGLNCYRIRPSLFDAGLNIFNCLSLVGNEELSGMTILWMIQYVKARQDCHNFYHPIVSVIPGNQIARWFFNQSAGKGNSISVDATCLRQDDKNWVGIVFCVVFCVSHPQNGSFSARRHYGTKTRHCTANLDQFLDVDPVTDKSDHMCLLYVNPKFYICSCERHGLPHFDHITLELQPIYWDWDVEVKKFGYRWVDEQELQLSNITSNHCQNSSNTKPMLI